MVFAKAELPKIDLSALRSELKEGDLDLQRLCNQVKEAWQQWGAFRVVNHGVEEELVNTVDSVSRDLFSLPTQVKERVVCLPFDGYSKVVDLSSAMFIAKTVKTNERKYVMLASFLEHLVAEIYSI
ncbi:hypothetical protein SUGI_1156140 [Cryptomeria japonica]|nr:hypothetical protein SUGI_1156140 [Cryptomeria japonica]